VKFKRFFVIFNLLFCILFSAFSFGREAFNFKIGDEVQVLSNKAFRKTKDNIFEAVGNVIITHHDNAIYGEKASLYFETGDTTVIGNVRYVGPEMTVYGTQMDYNFKTSNLEVKNGRVISDNYVVLGKSLTKRPDGTIFGVDAEYTTCKDCPESWSILGKSVHITVGQYIKITHAFIKAKGVIIMYIPYLILPIKKKRESGILFPKFSLNFDSGLKFGLPWFWAISDSTDMTVTPTLYGRRGLGGEYQFRHEFADRNWMEFNSLQLSDKVYVPFKKDREPSGTKNHRQHVSLEYNFDWGNRLRHHTYLTGLNDLDMMRDFGSFSNSKILGPELGISSFINLYTEYFDFNLEGDFNRNILFENPKEFDHSYVQVLPKFSIELIPISLFQSKLPLLHRFSFALDSDVTVFKQNHVDEGNYIRNARRVNLKPSLSWDMGQVGPLYLNSKATFDGQYYHFPEEVDGKTFNKSAIIYENQVSIKFEKLFGISYVESVDLKDVDVKKSTHSSIKEEDLNVSKDNEFVGKLPSDRLGQNNETLTVIQKGYKNSQELVFKHYYLGRSRENGNDGFLDQIKTSAGQFDALDAIRSKEIEVSHESSITTLPLSNTFELKWNNSLYRKDPRSINVFSDDRVLKRDFSYSRVAYFNLSQGYDFSAPGDTTTDKLTRLYLNTGFNIGNFSLSAYDYYFHKFGEHLFYINFSQSFNRFTLSSSFKYDSFSTPINKTILASASTSLNDLISLEASYEYDFDKKEVVKSKYGALYKPLNNCWRFSVDYESDEIEKNISFNFLINFNENNFTSLSGIE